MAVALGIDVGTTNVKAALVEDGDPPRVLARGSAPHPTSRPSSGWSEQDPAAWWSALLVVLDRLGSTRSQAASVAVSGQGSSFCLCDEAGRALGPAVGWQDVRATRDAAAIEARLGGELARAHGNPIGDAPEPKLVWLGREESDLVDRSYRALSAAATVSVRLGAEMALNEGDAGSWLSWNRRDRAWDGRVAGELGVERLLPEVAQLGSRIGEVPHEAAGATGLHPGTPIIASTTDVAAAAIAAGACDVGDVFYSKGTGGFLCVTVDEEVGDHAPLLALPVGNGSVQLCAASNAVGVAYDWVCGILGIDHGSAEQLATAASPGAGGIVVLPWLQGTQQPLLEPHARGMAFGLSLETGRGELLRGVLEGTALELRRNLGVAREVAGSAFAAVVTSGGPTRNELWNRLDAAAAETPMIVSPESDASVGTALVAGEAAGLWPCALGAGRAMRGQGVRFDPEPALVEAARAAAAIADELAEVTLPLFGTAAGRGRQDVSSTSRSA